jgi:hypothetical protein
MTVITGRPGLSGFRIVWNHAAEIVPTLRIEHTGWKIRVHELLGYFPITFGHGALRVNSRSINIMNGAGGREIDPVNDSSGRRSVQSGQIFCSLTRVAVVIPKPEFGLNSMAENRSRRRFGFPHVALIVETSTHDSAWPWLERWDGNGIIARASTSRNARKLLRSAVPTIDLNDQVRGLGSPQIHSDHEAIACLAA